MSSYRARYGQAAAGRIPSMPPCELYCHSLTDPTILSARLRAAGAQTLTLFGLHMPARLFRAATARGASAQPSRRRSRSVDSVLAEPLEECLLAGRQRRAVSGGVGRRSNSRSELADARWPHLPPRPRAGRSPKRTRSSVAGASRPSDRNVMGVRRGRPPRRRRSAGSPATTLPAPCSALCETASARARARPPGTVGAAAARRSNSGPATIAPTTKKPLAVAAGSSSSARSSPGRCSSAAPPPRRRSPRPTPALAH